MLLSADCLEYARDAAYAHIKKAVQALDELPLSDARSSLAAMAEFVVTRRQ